MLSSEHPLQLPPHHKLLPHGMRDHGGSLRGRDRLVEAVREHWKDHDVLYGFMPDHGCHQIDKSAGSHGLDMEEDMNILHFYGAKPRM